MNGHVAKKPGEKMLLFGYPVAQEHIWTIP